MELPDVPPRTVDPAPVRPHTGLLRRFAPARGVSRGVVIRAGRCAMLAVLVAGSGAIAEAVDTNKHLGVASCASGVCHGKLTPQESSNVWLNEYRIWSADDRHSRAYQTLLTAESREMARKLGLPNAQGAAICLDCHADNVPPEQRGPRFQLSDGVGCEACHGGAERWIESHTEPGATHADNLARGMLATEDVNVRAEICLSCHLGTRDQFATHRIMGAGHPRLSFEMEAYTVNQPAHYEIDDDYRARKPAPTGFDVWRAGQVETARRFLELLQSPLFGSGVPEFSFYDCHSCHHPMDQIRWPQIRQRQGLTPGGLRLHDPNLFMLQALVSVMAPGDESTFRRLHVALLRAGQRSVPATRAAAAERAGWLETRTWVRAAATEANVRAVRRAIAQLGASGALADYAAAEQAFLSIESLSLHLGDARRIGGALDRLYSSVESDRNYDPGAFQQAMSRLAGSL
jgi:hypothetical protein